MNDDDLGPYDELDTWGQIKRSLYRTWWPMRNVLTVNAWPVIVRGKAANKQVTKSERFRQMWGETLEEYHSRLRAYTLENEIEGQDDGEEETADTRRGA